MIPVPRSSRLFWILGVVLLVGTFVGVGVMLNHGSASSATDKQFTSAQPHVHEAMCIGFVDTINGVCNLYPTQLGRIVDMREEGYHAKKGEWLLKIDDQAARLQLQKAEALLEKAKMLPEQYKQKLVQQGLAVEDAKQQKVVADLDFAQKKRQKEFLGTAIVGPANDKNDKKPKQPNQYDDAFAMAEKEIKRLDFKIGLEESKLAELKLVDPKHDLDQAQAMYNLAKLAVEECELRAPADGTLLRSLVHVGETLGANPKMPAMQFAADGKKVIRAEILQEWAGHFKKGQVVEIEDDTYARRDWTGTIKSIGLWYGPTRSIILEPFRMNDVRSLECIIEVNDKDDTLRIGQRVRVGVVK